MVTALFFLVSLGLLAVVWSSCFVGCHFPTNPIPPPSYTKIIYAESSLIAYWWLSDGVGSTPPPPPFPAPPDGSTSIGTANDYSNNAHTGSYIIPPPYPVPPVAQSPSIIGIPVLNLQQNSIVPGDVATSDTSQPASVDFEGGYVSIPWSTQKPPQLDQFTFEAWIKPNLQAWTNPDGTTTGFLRVVFSAFVNNTGFRVLINDQNQLAVVIGQGASNNTFASNSAIDLTTITYIAVSCDTGGNLTLFAQGVDDPLTAPEPPVSAGYVPVDPTQQAMYFIGAGENNLPMRTLTMNPTGAPEFPFQGQIQSVALYSSANVDVQSHFASGSGG